MTESKEAPVFNPVALQNLEYSLMDDAELIDIEEDELRQIAGADMRYRCASLKLASRIVGIATAIKAEVGEEGVLDSMQDVMNRLSILRECTLTELEIEKNAPDYRAVFNQVTHTALDMLSEEWKWGKLAPAKTHHLSVQEISGLLKMFKEAPLETYGSHSEEINGDTWRHLALFDMVPKLYGLLNLFDYYQSDRKAMIGRLLHAIVEQAELKASVMTGLRDPGFVHRAVLQRMYSVSAGLMCEIYKEMAAVDVSRLRDMQPLDRSIMVVRYQQTGMKYDHIIEAHSSAMAHVLETTKVILELRPLPRRSAEDTHGVK